MQAAGKTALFLVASLCGRRSVVKLVKPPAGLPGILLNSLHQDSHSPLTGPVRNGHYKPTGQKGLSPADMGLLVGGVTIVGLGLYETYQSLCTALPNTGGDIVKPGHDQAVPSPAGVCHRTAAEPSLLETVSTVEDTSGGSMSDDLTPSPLETVRNPEDTSGGSMSMSPTTPALDEVPVAATNHMVESKKKPKCSAHGKGGILYSSIDELESENMSASVQQYDLVVDKPNPHQAGDLHATITEENHHEEYQSTLKASDFLSSPPVDTRGHVCREAEDMGDGAYKGGAGYLVDGDDGKMSAGVHDGSGNHAAGVANQGSSCLMSPSQYNSHSVTGSCCHHAEATAPAKKQHQHAVALAEMQDDDVIHTTCAAEFRDHDSDCECDLAGSTVPSSVSMISQAKVNKMASSHVVIIVS
uniref:Uncharacterized protein n=1 Tax=Branchiostoma floridae TaxID=7739 RepID=C3Y3F8_BRAFL|eukprot:XP_002609215.1 hypothetical protein BRAFLDRAFT_90668 [Branchiostoma floridae]